MNIADITYILTTDIAGGILTALCAGVLWYFLKQE